MTYDEAYEYVKSEEVPEEVSCLKTNTFYHEYYYSDGNSIVSEVNAIQIFEWIPYFDCLIVSGISYVKTVSGDRPYR